MCTSQLDACVQIRRWRLAPRMVLEASAQPLAITTSTAKVGLGKSRTPYILPSRPFSMSLPICRNKSGKKEESTDKSLQFSGLRVFQELFSPLLSLPSFATSPLLCLFLLLVVSSYLTSLKHAPSLTVPAAYNN